MPEFSPSVSKYFKPYEWQGQQQIVEDLILNALQQKGLNSKYIPKDNFVRDELFGDDTFAKFEKAVTIECYVKTVDTFEGQGDIFTRFGFQIADQMVITISKKRWGQIQEDLLLPEDDDTKKRPYPSAGDLMWFPLFNKLFEVTHVEKEPVFYQFGKTYTFDLTLELYKYNQDEFNTGFDAIDEVDDLFNRNTDGAYVEDENANTITDEQGIPILGDDYLLDDIDPRANNDFIDNTANSSVIDFDENSPFTRKSKW